MVCRNEEENPAFSLQATIPEVANVISTMHHNLTGELLVLDNNLKRLEQLGEIHSSQLDSLKSSIYPTFVEALSAVHFYPTVSQMPGFNYPISSASMPQSNTPARNNADSPTIPATLVSASNTVQEYTISRENHSSIKDLCREWHHGLAGGMSIQSLEEQYGSAWRKGSKSAESKFYKGRQLIMQEISKVLESGSNLEQAITLVQERCDQAGSLNKLVEQLRKAKRENRQQ
jgi:hypothetical protein